VVPFNLLTQSAGRAIPLGSDPLKGAFTAATLEVQPNNAVNFVATLTAGPYSPDGIAWVRNGNIVSQFLNEPPNNVALGGTRFVNPSNVYGWNTNYGAVGILHFVIVGSSLLQSPGISGLFGLGAFDTDGKNLYDVNGQVFNAATGTLVGSFTPASIYPPASAVLTDTSSRRTFLLDQYNGILAFDSTTLTQVGTINSLPVTNPPNRLLHWGSDGLSFLSYDYSTNAYNMTLLRSNLFYPSAGPNPLPVAISLSPPTVTSHGPNSVLTVNGSSFIRGAVVLWNGSRRTTKWVSSSKIIADIPASDIATPGTANITVSNPEPGGGRSGAIPLTIQ